MQVEFHPSERASLGIEVEFALIDTTDENLACVARDVLDVVGEGHPEGLHPFAKQELYQSTIEVITGINTTVAEARADLQRTIDELTPHLAERDVALACSGVHPFARWYELEFSPSERYEKLI